MQVKHWLATSATQEWETREFFFQFCAWKVGSRKQNSLPRQPRGRHSLTAEPLSDMTVCLGDQNLHRKTLFSNAPYFSTSYGFAKQLFLLYFILCCQKEMLNSFKHTFCAFLCVSTFWQLVCMWKLLSICLNIQTLRSTGCSASSFETSGSFKLFAADMRSYRIF